MPSHYYDSLVDLKDFMKDSIQDLLLSTDLGSVFLISLLEKFLPFLPSYVLFPAIGAGAAGLSDLLWRCATAIAGSFGGAAIWYLLGVAIGPGRVRRLVRRHGHWLFITPRLYERMADAYQRRPFMVTFVGQMIPGVRIYQALPAGVLRIPAGPFLFATLLGATCWTVPLAWGGYILRHRGWTPGEVGLFLTLAMLVIEAAAFLSVRLLAGRRKLPSANGRA